MFYILQFKILNSVLACFVGFCVREKEVTKFGRLYLFLGSLKLVVHIFIFLLLRNLDQSASQLIDFANPSLLFSVSVWSNWSFWSKCNSACGLGSRNRVRSRDCATLCRETQTETCNGPACPVGELLFCVDVSVHLFNSQLLSGKKKDTPKGDFCYGRLLVGVVNISS